MLDRTFIYLNENHKNKLFAKRVEQKIWIQNESFSFFNIFEYKM